MSPFANLSRRQLRIGVDIVTGLVVVSVGFALAGLTWRLLGHAGTGAITMPSGASAPAGGDVAPAVALAPFGRGAVSDATQPTTLPLELKGIVAGDPPSISTALIAANGQPAQAYRIGQSVGGATIEGIVRDRVILRNAGRVEYLGFPLPTPSATPGQAPAPVAAAPVPTPVPVLTDALKRFDASPAEGGYKLGANAPAGLLPGDVLLSVNGTALNDSTAAAAALQGAQSSGSATIQILRDGKRLTLTVPIR